MKRYAYIALGVLFTIPLTYRIRVSIERINQLVYWNELVRSPAWCEGTGLAANYANAFA